ncbi:hypothetical protein V6N13_083696 [Hibiscus sabdariffa]
MGRILVSAVLIFCSLALVNYDRGIKDTSSDFWEQALDAGFGSSLHQKDEQIYLARDVSALTSRDSDTNSSAIALSEINQTAGWGYCSDCFVEFSLPYSSQQEDYGNSGVPFFSPRPRIAKLRRHGGRISIGVGVAEPERSNISVARKVVFKVGVAVNSNITRFSIDVFEAAVRLVPYEITYKLIFFDGSSDELINKVARETYDVAIGDIVITRSRNQHVDFSPPYLEPGFMMVAKAKTKDLNKFWWFLSPFTAQMWLIIAALNVLIGLVIWVIESQYEDGPNFLEALFLLQRRPGRNTLARIMVTVRVFMLLILTQVYTTVLTNSLLDPSVLDFNSLRQTNSVIGCDRQSQAIWYLVNVLGFNRRNVKVIASFADYKEALYSGSIKAAFLFTPYAKILLANYCQDLIEINPTYGNNLGGLRFVFPKGSLLANDIADAILKLERTGELQHMEDQISASFDCSRKPFEDARAQNVGAGSFMGVFVLCGELHIAEKQEEFRRCGVDIK